MENIEEDKEAKILLKKLNDLEKKVIDFLNVKLKVNITGKEISLDLNNKNIGNFELMLLAGILYDNVENLNLSHNNISDIRPLKDLKKIKKLDLSFNNLKDYSIHSISDVRRDVIKENSSLIKNISINLDNNNLVEKEINEIKNIIISGYEISSNSDGKEDNQTTLLNKLNRLEKKILGYFNNKLNIKLTGKEVKIDLNNKNIGNIELNLLSSVDFKELEEINLSHNNISDIEPLKNFKKLKNIDLSFNKINNINSLKSISKINNKLEKIKLNNNMINDVEIIKENIFPYIIEINLDNNNIIKKDIDEIKMMIINNNKKEIKMNKIENLLIIKYKIKKKSIKIRLFGKSFFKNNKDKWEMTVNGKKGKITEKLLVSDKDELQIELKPIKKIINMSYMFSGCKSLSSISNIGNWNTSNVIDMSFMFLECSSLISLSNIENWDTNKVTDMSGMFGKCSSLSSLPNIGNWNTSNVTDMSEMFAGCSSLLSLQSIENWNTGNVTNMLGMFDKCSSLSSLPNIGNWNTGNVTDMSYMFRECSSLSSLSNIENWNTGKIIDMKFMFEECSSLVSLPNIGNWNISNVTDMECIFSGCCCLSSLPDISNWNTSNVTNMSGIFNQCYSLSSLPDISKWNTSNVTNMSELFSQCSSLSSIPNIGKWNIKKVTFMTRMFSECSSLSTLSDIDKWDWGIVSKIKKDEMFRGCCKIKKIPLKFTQ